MGNFNAKDYKVKSDIPISLYTFSFTRPNDSNAYALYDAISDSTSTPTLFTMNVRKGLILNANLKTGKTGGVINTGAIKVRLFNAPISPVADNAQNPMLWANKSKGFADLDFTLLGGGTSSDAVGSKLDNLNKIVMTDTIYLLFEAAGAYTPVTLQEFYLEIEILGTT
jgi:hypothetical protein